MASRSACTCCSGMALIVTPCLARSPPSVHNHGLLARNVETAARTAGDQA
jgi:hypothetical protein